MKGKGTLADNLKRCRLVLGLDQAQVAERAEISRMAYVKIESGKTMPREETLAQLARALNVSPFDLFKEPALPSGICFRTHKTATAKDQARQEQTVIKAFEWLKNYCFLQEVTQSATPSRLGEFGRTAGENIESFVERVRGRLLQNGAFPVDSLPDSLEAWGVKVLFTPFLTEKSFGFSFAEHDGGPAIVVNSAPGVPAERQLFTLVHELGHLLLHDGVSDGASTDIEKEADCFAAAFLIPRKAFDACWAAHDGRPWFDRVLAVKRVFKVSYKTVLMRLQEKEPEKPVFVWFQQNYQCRFARALPKTEEPVPSPINLSADGFMALAKKAFLDGEISESRLAELLNRPLAETHKRVMDWSQNA